MLPHGVLHVAPGGEDALAPDAGHIVHDLVEDSHADVRHADLVGVREAKSDTGVDLRKVLYRLIVFAAHVAGRLLHTGQNALQAAVNCFVHRRTSMQN